MKRLITNIITSIFVMMISPALFAQDIDGTWKASMDTPQGPVPIIFEFTANGNSFSGTMSNAFMGLIPISEGMHNGTDVTFKLSMEGGPGGDMVVNYRGTLDGDTLNLISTFESGAPPGGPAEQPLTAKRAN